MVGMCYRVVTQSLSPDRDPFSPARPRSGAGRFRPETTPFDIQKVPSIFPPFVTFANDFSPLGRSCLDLLVVHVVREGST
jgi:hypothetical protein